MDRRREVKKYGFLQTKVMKKNSTLLRKKKFVFEEQKWVVLCVHDKRIPFLEWYSTVEEIQEHEPLRVMDLLNCLFVSSSVSNDRHIHIGFEDDDRPMMEFAAKNPEDVKEWVQELTCCLRELNCLPNADNEYQTFPVNSGESSSTSITADLSLENNKPSTPIPRISPTFRRINLSDEIPLPTSTPVIPPRPQIMPKLCTKIDENSNAHHDFSPPDTAPNSPLNRKPGDINLHSRNRSSASTSEPVDPAPELPRRQRKVLGAPLPLSPVNKTQLLPNGHQYDFPLTPAAVAPRHANQEKRDLTYVCDIAQPHVSTSELSMGPSRDTSSTGNEIIERDVSSRLSQEMVQLRMSSASSSTTEDSHDSTRSNPNEYVLISPLARPSTQLRASSGSLNYAGSYRELRAPSRTISLQLLICAEHLSLVEIAGSIWIAGWSESQNMTLPHILHVGDQLLEVDDKPVNRMNQFPEIFYQLSKPGVPIPLKIRTMPHGSTYILRKPRDLYTPRTFGIIFHKKKNKIEEIVPNTRASRAGIPAKMSPFLYGREEVASVVTEVNGIPLNPFANNEQFYKRIEKLPIDSEIKLVIHPHDFVKLLKQQLKTIKNYKHFIQDY